MVNNRAMDSQLVGWGLARAMWVQVDVSSKILTSPSQLDNDLSESYRVSGCTV